MPTKIVVVGMGYVGIPAAALLADVEGNIVTGVQRRSKRSGWKIDALNEGQNPIGGDEPGLEELIKRTVVDKKTFTVTDSLDPIKEADYILIDVQTPTDADHIPRYESLRAVSADVGKLFKEGATVIIESTVAPGTTNNIVKPILEEHSGKVAGSDFHLVFSYERVMVGRLIHNIVKYPRAVGGLTPACTQKGLELYKDIIDAPLVPTDAITAEIAKVTENTYRDVNIAFANEVAMICESMGADFHEVRELVNNLPNDPSNPHANPHRNLHFAGGGVGGHCLPKDPWLLKWGNDNYGTIKFNPKVVVESRYINMWMPTHMVQLTKDALNEAGREIKGSKIALLGFAFLENSDDTRNTPSRDAYEELQKLGAEVMVHDHLVRDGEGVPLETDLWKCLEGAHAVIIMTRHKPYYDIDLAKLKGVMETPVLIDGRNVFEPKVALDAGLIFRGIGKGRS